MKFDRYELKGLGKSAFKRNYWTCVAACLIYTIIYGALMTYSSSRGASVEDLNEATKVSITISPLVYPISIFVINPLLVGLAAFFTNNLFHDADLKEVFSAFTGGEYVNIMGAMLITNLITGLFTLALIVPGIIKSYEYRLVPYILAENPSMKGSEARAISSKAMQGNKMNVFLLDLSFIGWLLVTVITFGIAGIFYVTPYIMSTNAAVYRHVCHDDAPTVYHA